MEVTAVGEFSMAGKTAEKKKCLVDDCDKDATSRGLCNNCYQSARKLIAKGNTTWEELEEMGLANASGTKKSSALKAALNAKREEEEKPPIKETRGRPRKKKEKES